MKWIIGYSLPCRAVKIIRERAFKTESGISIKPHKGEQWCYCPSDPAPQVFSVLAACQHLPCLILSILPILSLPLSLVTSTYSNMFQLYLILHISLTARTFMTNNSEWHLPSFCVPSQFFFFLLFIVLIRVGNDCLLVSLNVVGLSQWVMISYGQQSSLSYWPLTSLSQFIHLISIKGLFYAKHCLRHCRYSKETRKIPAFMPL